MNAWIALLLALLLSGCVSTYKPPVVVSNFCPLVADEVRKLKRLENGEIAALRRPTKEAILSIRLKYAKRCTAPTPAK